GHLHRHRTGANCNEIHWLQLSVGGGTNAIGLAREVLDQDIEDIIARLVGGTALRIILDHFFQGLDFLLRIFYAPGFVISPLFWHRGGNRRGRWARRRRWSLNCNGLLRASR